MNFSMLWLLVVVYRFVEIVLALELLLSLLFSTKQLANCRLRK